MTTKRMSHIRIMAQRHTAPETLVAIRDLGAVQIDGVNNMDTFQLTDAQRREQARIKNDLSRLDGIINRLGLSKTSPPDELDPVSIEAALQGVASLIPKVRDLNNRLNQLEEQHALLPRYQRTIERLIPHMPEGESIAAAVVITDPAVLDELKHTIRQQISGEVTLTSGEIDDEHSTLLISAPDTQRDELTRLLQDASITRLRLPIDSPDSPEDALAQLETRAELVEREITDLQNEMDVMREKHKADLLMWRAVLEQEAELYDVLGKLGETERAFVLEGWIPEERQDDLKQALPAHTVLEEIPIEEEDVPVQLDNMAVAKPFEGLLSLLGRPHYQALDPTGLMAIFLPLFFGMMLGDIGYGAVVLGLNLFLRTRFKGILRDITTILAMGGAWAIVFGVIFGELFGTLGHDIGLEPILFDRANPAHVTDLLLLTVGVGVAHIVLGLVIGLWRSIQKDETDEVMETGGKLIGLIAALILVAVLADFLPSALMTPAIAGIIVGIVILGISLGGRRAIISPIEFVSTIGNIISYLRIAAIGLASVYLAVVANEIAGAVGTAVVGVIIAVLLHALNIVLGMFTPTIQSLRLHYVEFFGQFYDSGGRPYEPYKSKL